MISRVLGKNNRIGRLTQVLQDEIYSYVIDELKRNHKIMFVRNNIDLQSTLKDVFFRLNRDTPHFNFFAIECFLLTVMGLNVSSYYIFNEDEYNTYDVDVYHDEYYSNNKVKIIRKDQSNVIKQVLRKVLHQRTVDNHHFKVCKRSVLTEMVKEEIVDGFFNEEDEGWGIPSHITTGNIVRYLKPEFQNLITGDDIDELQRRYMKSILTKMVDVDRMVEEKLENYKYDIDPLTGQDTIEDDGAFHRILGYQDSRIILREDLDEDWFVLQK